MKFLGKKVLGIGLFFGVLTGVTACSGAKADAATLYRAYNPNTGEHLYTENYSEIPAVVRAGWRNEGNAWEVPSKGAPVYRLFNPNNGGDHFYTLNANEKNHLRQVGWRYEGISWQSGGNTPVYRLYNPNARSGAHHFTVSASERDHLRKAGWRYEGVAFYSGKVVTPQQPQSQPVNIKEIESQISQKLMMKINVYRTSKGIRQLDGSDILTRAVATRANDLYSLYDHKRPDGSEVWDYVNNTLGYSYYGRCGGENIWGAVYDTNRHNPEGMANAIIDSWKKSPGHRGLLESADSNEGAIGIKLANQSGTSYDISAVFLTGINNKK